MAGRPLIETGRCHMSDTIAAIATGNIVSSIGIIRISGEKSIEIADYLFLPKNLGPMCERRDRQLVFGCLHDNRGEVLDYCLCTITRAPNSYTGENTAEFQCHGSPMVLSMTMEAIFEKGARQALPGEFTKRAFLNGRMDLTEAEAVIDLIESETAEAARNAAGQLGGAISVLINKMYNQLVDIISHYCAVLDYPDEDIDEFDYENYQLVFAEIESGLSDILETFGRGRIMKSGIKTAIVGRTNAGKSSLLNALLGYERSIVTEIPGTTRDTIEESILIGGIRLCLTDTAGLRCTEDPVEKIGIDRALSVAKSSELLLAVFDGSTKLNEEDFEAIKAAKEAKESIAVINKYDLPQTIEIEGIKESFKTICRVSAIDKTGIDTLENAISGIFPMPKTPAGEIITNSRQADSLARALNYVKAAGEAIKNNLTPDIVITETEGALISLGELSGKTIRDDISDRIFERFCVGK